ncbi:MAG: flagellar hook-basal body complex protein FliE [Oscillospiraceae bacterium]
MNIVPLSSLPPITPLFDINKVDGQNVQSQQATSGVPVFGSILKDAIANLEQTQAVSQQDSYDLALGKTDDLHTVQINAMKASAAVELAAGITSRALGAYKEIMQTQL